MDSQSRWPDVEATLLQAPVFMLHSSYFTGSGLRFSLKCLLSTTTELAFKGIDPKIIFERARTVEKCPPDTRRFCNDAVKEGSGSWSNNSSSGDQFIIVSAENEKKARCS